MGRGRGRLSPVYEISMDGGGGEMRVVNKRRIITCGDVVGEIWDTPEVDDTVHASG